MTLKLKNAYVAVRDIETTLSGGIGGPSVPDTWKAFPQSNNWWTYEKPNGDIFAARKMNQVSTQGLFIVFGDKEYLDQIASGSTQTMPGREAWRRRAEAQVNQALRYWPDWRCSGFERDSEGNPVRFISGSRTLIPMGENLPNFLTEPLPWDLDQSGNLTSPAAASIRITDFHRPALKHTLAGLGMNDVAEDEPDRG